MNLAATPLSWNACLSALRLDRWMMGELDAADAETVGTHVSACAACSAALAGMRGVREEVRALPLPAALGRPAPRRHVPAAALAGLGLALAASVVVLLRSPPASERSKGTGLALTMYVQHGGQVRRAAPGEHVSPGDAVRFAVSTPTPAYVAVLSLDPAGRASVYFPQASRAAQIPAGTEVPLPLGTRLDATTGEERLLGIFCGSAVDLEPIRAALERGQDAAPLPADCQGLRWSFVKRSIALLLSLSPAAALAQVERYAVVVGNDVGEPPDVPLRYAEMDAARMVSVLQEVGGVRPENTVLLQGKDADTVRRALIAVNERVRTAGRPTVLLVYYSGHADAGALHLGGSRLDLAELEQLVRGSAAGFRLLILDACRSGALTRVKGGTPIPPFEIRLGERVAGEGAVFLTSSSASEDSQESDELKGSFFTHALLSGLLGAADENRDGRVTLDEAYRYAYETTLRASSRTFAGTQHPTFQYDVRGTGDLVLATLDARSPTRAWLELPPGKSWLLFQENADGAVVGEVASADRVRRLSLRAGRYFLRGRGPEVLLEGTVAVAPGSTATVDESKLQRTAYARLVRKGQGDRDSVMSLEAEARFRTSLVTDAGLCPGVAVGLAVALRPITLVPRVAWCRTGYTSEGLAATTDQLDIELQASHVWDLAPVSIEVGLTVGATLLNQSFKTEGSAPPRTTAALQLTPAVAVSRDLGSRTYLYLTVAGATYLFKNESSATQTTSFGPSFAVRVALGFGYRF